jgi:hypothetical protein
MCRNEYAKPFSRSLDAVSRVYDESGNVIKTHEHVGDFGGLSNQAMTRTGQNASEL